MVLHFTVLCCFNDIALRFLIGFGIDISYRQLLCATVLVRYEYYVMYQNLSIALVLSIISENRACQDLS